MRGGCWCRAEEKAGCRYCLFIVRGDVLGEVLTVC